MKGRFWPPAVGVLLLAACAPGSSIPDGEVFLDEEVSLVRGPDVDSAQREFDVEGNSVVVALVDEKLTDIRLQLAIIDPGGKASAPIEVENNLRGAGMEVAALTALRDSHIRVTLTGQQDAKTPGHVRLRLRRFDADKHSKFLNSREALRAWSIATTASYRADDIRKSGVSDIDRAISGLASPAGDATLEAQARLIKAHMLRYFHVDWRESRAEARRAVAAFRALPTPDRLGEARAQYAEALSLMKISVDRKSVDPTAEEAAKLARETLTALSADTSAFDAIERRPFDISSLRRLR